MRARLLAGILAGIVAITPLASTAQQGVTVVVNGQTMSFDQPPIVQAGRVFVPLRGVFEQLGATVVYQNGQINASAGQNTVSLTIGSTQATVNGAPVILDVAPFVVDSRTLVPLRFIAQSLGASVEWNDSTSSVAISTGSTQRNSDWADESNWTDVDTAPPSLPAYDQPDAPAPNYIWMPGFWGWSPSGYYWVPGTWALAPQTGLYWTPGYWETNGQSFAWHPGYWAAQVGFYGGIAYGFGYFGSGYQGGRWGPNGFAYNTAYSRVNRTTISNVYVQKTVNVTLVNHVSYNGGQSGIHAQATTQELAVSKLRHVPMTAVQVTHVRVASQDRDQYISTNHGKPALPAVAKPLAAPRAGARPLPTPARRAMPPVRTATPIHTAMPSARTATPIRTAMPPVPTTRPIRAAVPTRPTFKPRIEATPKLEPRLTPKPTPTLSPKAVVEG